MWRSYIIRSNYSWVCIFVHTTLSSIMLVIIVLCWLLICVHVLMRAVVIAVRKIWVEAQHILGQVTWQSLTHQGREFPCEMNAVAAQCPHHSHRMEPGGFNRPWRFLVGFDWLLISDPTVRSLIGCLSDVISLPNQFYYRQFMSSSDMRNDSLVTYGTIILCVCFDFWLISVLNLLLAQALIRMCNWTLGQEFGAFNINWKLISQK